MYYVFDIHMIWYYMILYLQTRNYRIYVCCTSKMHKSHENSITNQRTSGWLASWLAGWRTTGHKNDSAYENLMKIPWKSYENIVKIAWAPVTRARGLDCRLDLVAGWLAAGWLAGWLAVGWLAGWKSGLPLAGHWLAAGWLADWLAFGWLFFESKWCYFQKLCFWK